jgi:hypothetical protein
MAGSSRVQMIVAALKKASTAEGSRLLNTARNSPGARFDAVSRKRRQNGCRSQLQYRIFGIADRIDLFDDICR